MISKLYNLIKVLKKSKKRSPVTIQISISQSVVEESPTSVLKTPDLFHWMNGKEKQSISEK